MRKPGRSAGAVEQPGAKAGTQTYCPVSGVVFDVTEKSATRELSAGVPLFFCCESCARWFDEHRDRVLDVRGIAAVTGRADLLRSIR